MPKKKRQTNRKNNVKFKQTAASVSEDRFRDDENYNSTLPSLVLIKCRAKATTLTPTQTYVHLTRPDAVHTQPHETRDRWCQLALTEKSFFFLGGWGGRKRRRDVTSLKQRHPMHSLTWTCMCTPSKLFGSTPHANYSDTSDDLLLKTAWTTRTTMFV